MNSRDRTSSRARWAAAYEELRQNLIRAREAALLTQREAASKLGRSQSYVAKSESGERRIDVVELLQFAAVYSVKLDSLLPRVTRGTQAQ